MSTDHKKRMKIRGYLVSFFFVLIWIVVLVRTFLIQIEGRKNIFIDAGDERIPARIVERQPRAGEILDESMAPLVSSVSYFNIRMDATVVDQEVFDKNVTDLAKGLARLYPKLSAKEYENRIRRARSTGNKYLILVNKVTNEERKRLRKLPIFELGRMKGGIIDNEEIIIRSKPNGDLLSRTLGYYKIDEKSKRVLRVGIEGAYYDYLKGEAGQEIEEKYSNGWKKTGQVLKEAVEGATLVTSINKEIQELAHSELEKQLKEMKADHGCVIVMDVKTGFVKALATLGSNGNGGYIENYNYAFGEAEVPGSTFKLASIMAGLEDGKFTLNTMVNATGKYVFNEKAILKDANKNGYGRITVKEAFEQSSNVISKLLSNAYRNDPELFFKRMDQFGLTQKTGIELVGEREPYIRRPGDSLYSALTIPWMSIGYEMRMTPLQILTFYNAVANNGKMLRPQFVKEIRRNGEVAIAYEPYVLNEQICSPATIKGMKSCLEGVMRNGTGKSLTSTQFEIAGKTGTAKLLNTDKKFGQDELSSNYQASFVGYFPAKEPIYSCIVVISKPKVAYYGARVSGTVFAAIANKVYASQLQYHKAINESSQKIAAVPTVKTGRKSDITTLLKWLGIRFQLNDESNWISSEPAGEKLYLNQRPVGRKMVPSVIGMTAKDAIYILEERGLVVQMKGFGKVTKQSIAVGEKAIAGQLIKIQLEP